MASSALVRSLYGRPAAPWEWQALVGEARAMAPVLGAREPALPDSFFLVPVGAITATAPGAGVTVILPETDLLAVVAGPAGGRLQYAVAAATAWHELAHVMVLRRLPTLSELSEDGRRLMEAVALSAQSRALAHLLADGTWQYHLAAILRAARTVAEEVEDPMLEVYEAAGAALLGELEGATYSELVELVVDRLAAE